jgi:hypothetical protein
MANVNFGEVFHNFFIDGKLKKVCRSGSGTRDQAHEVSGCRFKPGTLLCALDEVIYGHEIKPLQCRPILLHWGGIFARSPKVGVESDAVHRICLNLPCVTDYDPGLPTVMTWNNRAMDNKGRVAGDVITFVDDGRITGFSKENCHEVHR